MKVGFYSTDWDRSSITYGGTMHYRLALPAKACEAAGIETVLAWDLQQETNSGALCPVTPDGTRHDDCDIIVCQRWMGSNGADITRRARAAGQIVINDVDDWYWGLPPSNVAFVSTNPRNSPHFNRTHYLGTLQASSAVTVSTPYLAERIGERIRTPIHVLRNLVDLDQWPILDASEEPANVGWVGGIPWRDSDLQLLGGVLAPFLNRHKLLFFHGGHVENAPTAHGILGLNPARCHLAPLCSIDAYPTLWEPIRIALVPITSHPFNLAKSWLKGLEASACGLPFIASDLPEYRALGALRRAKNPQQWTKHLESLLDPVVRKDEGLANRLRAEHLSIQNLGGQWPDLYRQLAEGAK